MEIEEVKEMVVDITSDLGCALPYEITHIEAEDWDGLAYELRELASLVCYMGNRIAGYAGYVAREATKL